jgi:hypothetical protein
MEHLDFDKKWGDINYQKYYCKEKGCYFQN